MAPCYLPLAAALLLLLTCDAVAGPLSKERFKSGSAVRKAFAQVVAEPSRSTVRILADGEKVALGAIVGADGFVLTKASQLKEGRLTCRLKDQRQFAARIIGVHTDFDLAMLKIEAVGLPAVRWKPGDDPAVGGWLATPGLASWPVAVGVVSVKRRRIPRERGVLGIEIDEDKPGPRITQVTPNSGADKAGLKLGDIVTQAAGEVVRTGRALSKKLRSFGPGESLTLRVLRGSKQVDLRATLGYPRGSIRNLRMWSNRVGGKLSRRRGGFPLVLQHDTVLRPEDCGGPVVDLSGQAIGINIARAGRTATFAVPAGVILPLLDDLKSGKLALPENTDRGSSQRRTLKPASQPLPEDLQE